MQERLNENTAAREKIGYSLTLARSEEEVREAQRLRYKVFVEELGARVQTRIPNHDIDLYDAFCEHLIVRENDGDRVVGTYRILSPAAARRVGNYYSENEFYINRLQNLRGRMVEVGRSCIHPDHRSGAVITLLWAGLADYMVRNNYDYLIGCASIGMADGGHNAANLFSQLAQEHMAPAEYRVFPQHGLPFERLADGRTAMVPPLIKGYLRVGAWVCGEPAWDPDFNTADLLLLLPMSRMNPRYLRHFVKPSAALVP
ncbi:MAG: GNAT family N-acetyltransferase [Sterolibacteriaceae bacterium]|uniref:GNAT family N-acetyltransferase n=1 Tax=Sulfuritalea sp. TaxID=2480090 RepID=UPI001A5EEDD8|nr:GNAT family N-acyltransferase [Sulfuritalea sp.]MBL8479604.1 GNAT family N-acetyltransferase [Sterolibacteriaceae bacterium]MBN8475683.1 GNAT family N-acetyltransferase [Sulfuritalea sp.]